MAEQQWADLSGIFRRRRASDRARERAGRAAYFGDRAGLLIATADVAQLVFSREITANDSSDPRELTRGRPRP
jgi:hypothetical protein